MSYCIIEIVSKKSRRAPLNLIDAAFDTNISRLMSIVKEEMKEL